MEFVLSCLCAVVIMSHTKRLQFIIGGYSLALQESQSRNFKELVTLHLQPRVARNECMLVHLFACTEQRDFFTQTVQRPHEQEMVLPTVGCVPIKKLT